MQKCFFLWFVSQVDEHNGNGRFQVISFCITLQSVPFPIGSVCEQLIMLAWIVSLVLVLFQIHRLNCLLILAYICFPGASCCYRCTAAALCILYTVRYLVGHLWCRLQAQLAPHNPVTFYWGLNWPVDTAQLSCDTSHRLKVKISLLSFFSKL